MTTELLQWYKYPNTRQVSAVEVEYACHAARIYRRTTDKRPESRCTKVQQAVWYQGIHGGFEPWNGIIPTIPNSDWTSCGISVSKQTQST